MISLPVLSVTASVQHSGIAIAGNKSKKIPFDLQPLNPEPCMCADFC